MLLVAILVPARFLGSCKSYQVKSNPFVQPSYLLLVVILVPKGLLLVAKLVPLGIGCSLGSCNPTK